MIVISANAKESYNRFVSYQLPKGMIIKTSPQRMFIEVSSGLVYHFISRVEKVKGIKVQEFFIDHNVGFVDKELEEETMLRYLITNGKL